MKIVSIDSDNEHSHKIQEYFNSLSIEGSLFSSFNDFYEWLEYLDGGDTVKIDFFFVDVKHYDDENFSESVLLKEKLSNNIPVIIFMLSQHCDKSYIKSLKYGAGYLLKPFSSDLFVSAIHYHSKHSEINRLLGKKNKELLEYKKATDREYAIVESIFSNHYEEHLFASDQINFYISPASVFNGDVLLTERGPSGSIYLAIGDVTGHGLSAAIGAMPVYSTFRTMAKKGISVGTIGNEMNSALRTLLPSNMMMAAIIMELDYSDGTAVIWSGGMPDVIVVNDQAEIVRKIGSRHSPLSMLEPEVFRKDIDIVHLQKGDRLFFYTDGIEEANNCFGEMFGSERLLSIFEGESDKIFNKIVDAHKHFIGNSPQDDDITLVELVYDTNTPLNSVDAGAAISNIPAIQWQMLFVISPIDIKKTDPLSQVINFLNNAINISVHQDYISTVLSELFNNALDHGLLELDSSEKNTDDGFINYYIERRKKIETLSEGQIDIKLSYLNNDNNEGHLEIIMTDTGTGFDCSSLVYDEQPQSRGYGHGLNLVHSLCNSVEYSNSGRTVKAIYKINSNG